jgi:hypothetical protein
MARRVIDENHARRTGFATPDVCMISLKMSSPSRPASQALTTTSTSLRRIALCSAESCFCERPSRAS